jgi:hypothetical protein
LIGLAQMPDEFPSLPAGWKNLSEKRVGDIRARLFVRP